ncbi:MAG: NYN domain-containing protein [Anaerolineae bacterium]
MQRAIAYIDGINLYHGLRAKAWKRFYWLDVQRMAQLLLKPDQTLVCTKHFTSVVSHPADKRKRQSVFLDALATLPDLSIFRGHYLSDTVTCRSCGHTYLTHHGKMTDVNISVKMLSDAFLDRCDVALVISADSDLVGPIKALRCLFPEKRAVIAFPPARYSNALRAEAHACLHITANMLSRSRFPEVLTTSAGAELRCPAEWH